MIPLTRHVQCVIERCMRGDHVCWSHVALQLGRPVHSVRLDYDPTYQDNAEPRAPAAPRPDPGPTWPGWTPEKVTDLKRYMKARETKPMTSREVAAALGAPSPECVLGKAWRMGMVFTQKRGGFEA